MMRAAEQRLVGGRQRVSGQGRIGSTVMDDLRMVGRINNKPVGWIEENDEKDKDRERHTHTRTHTYIHRSNHEVQMLNQSFDRKNCGKMEKHKKLG